MSDSVSTARAEGIAIALESDGSPRFAADVRSLARERDELRVPLCIGQKTIERLAREGAVALDSGHSLVAADELFRADPYAALVAERQRAEKAEAEWHPWRDLLRELVEARDACGRDYAAENVYGESGRDYAAENVYGEKKHKILVNAIRWYSEGRLGRAALADAREEGRSCECSVADGDGAVNERGCPVHDPEEAARG